MIALKTLLNLAESWVDLRDLLMTQKNGTWQAFGSSSRPDDVFRFIIESEAQ
jgi:hypothetical protein